MLQVRVDVVEIDPAIAKVAKDQFGFNESDRLKVFIDDGLEFIANLDGRCISKIPIYFRTCICGAYLQTLRNQLETEILRQMSQNTFFSTSNIAS